MSIWKWLKLPSGETTQVQAADTWHVRWFSQGRVGNSGSGDTLERLEVFYDEKSAIQFRDRLKEAAELLQDFQGYIYMGGSTWGPRVEKNTYKGLA